MAEAEERRKKRAAIRRDMIMNMSRSFTSLTLHSKSKSSQNTDLSTERKKSTLFKPFKARQVPSSFKEERLDKLRYESNLRKLVVKEVKC